MEPRIWKMQRSEIKSKVAGEKNYSMRRIPQLNSVVEVIEVWKPKEEWW
jgi:hypothetical protein